MRFIITVLRFPLSFAIYYLFGWLIQWPVSWYFQWINDLNTFWSIVVFIFGGIVIWLIIVANFAVAGFCSAFSSLKIITAVILSIYGIGTGVLSVYATWKLTDFHYTKDAIIGIVLIGLIVGLTFSTIYGAVFGVSGELNYPFAYKKREKKSYLNTLDSNL